MHRRNWLWVALLFALALIQGFGINGLAQSDFNQYKIEATFDPNNQVIHATQTIAYINDSKESLNAVFFFLLPNYDRQPNPYLDPSELDAGYPDGFDPSWLKIEAATDAENKPLQYNLLKGPATFQSYSLDDTLLKVMLPSPLAPGAKTQITLTFTTHFPNSNRGDEARFRDIYLWRFAWNPVAVLANDLIHGEYTSDQRPYYQYAIPSALYELTLSVPAGYQVAVGADQQEVIKETATETTIHATNAIPVRSLPLGISKLFKVYHLPESDPSIWVYYLPGDDDSAVLLASNAKEILTAYRARWGEYPHRRLLIVETPSTAAGFAGATADAFTLINQTYFSDRNLAVRGLLDRLTDYLLAHEIAHQWWGIGVGQDINAENFLSESFAQYLSITYFERKYGEFGPNVFQLGRDGLLERFVDHQFGYINLREHLQGDLPYVTAFVDRFDEALIKPQKDVKYYNFDAERLYNKGYLILRALRGVIGEKAMDELLRVAHARYVYKIASVKDFQNVAEEVSGKNLNEFFQTTLFDDTDENGHAPYADYGIDHVDTLQKAGDSYEYHVHLFHDGKIRLPVEVDATDKDNHVQSQSWKLADQDQRDFVMNFQTTKPLKEVGVDPKSLVPDVNRLNNYYVLDGLSIFNRKLEINTTGRNSVPIDSYTIGVDPINQYLQGGYLLDHRWTLGHGIIQFAKNFGRGDVLNVISAFTPVGWLGELSLRQTYYSHPETGLLGTYWEPTDQTEITLARETDSSGSPFYDRRSEATGKVFNLFGLTWLHQESVQRLFASWFRVLDDPNSFIRFDGALWHNMHLSPGINLDGQIAAGWGDNPTGIFRFNLGDLSGYAAAPGYPFVGNAFFLGEVNLRIPFQREMEYNLLNAAVLEQMDERFFFEFGNIWSDSSKMPTDVSQLLDGVRSQIGFEVSLSGRTFGGLFPWAVRIGITYPLSNIDEDHRILKQYIQVSTPFF